MSTRRDNPPSFPSPVADGGGARAAGGGGSPRPYHKPLIATDLATNRSKELRTGSTPPERILWRHFCGKQIAGLKFRRQHPLGPFIADFYCHKQALVIEIDGGTHTRDQARHDTERDRWMGSRGIRVLRFAAKDVFSNIEGVVRTIEREAVGKPPPSAARTPPPSATGEEK